jgi:hypothetical protein
LEVNGIQKAAKSLGISAGRSADMRGSWTVSFLNNAVRLQRCPVVAVFAAF